MPGDKVYREIYHCVKHSKNYCLLSTAFNLTQNVNFHIFFKRQGNSVRMRRENMNFSKWKRATTGLFPAPEYKNEEDL